jgi:hypothetical protein
MTLLGKLAQYIAISKMRQLSLSLATRLGEALLGSAAIGRRWGRRHCPTGQCLYDCS